jgi:hypothetical protein
VLGVVCLFVRNGNSVLFSFLVFLTVAQIKMILFVLLF